MSDLERYSHTYNNNSLREQYERLEKGAQELLHRNFSLVERFVTKGTLVKLAERLQIEEQEEALRGRLEAMQLARITALNEQQTQLRALLSMREIQCNAELIDRAAQIYNRLLDSLCDRDFALATSFEEKLQRLEKLKDPEIKERHRRQLLGLLDQSKRMMDTLNEASNQALNNLSTAYSARTPLK